MRQVLFFFAVRRLLWICGIPHYYNLMCATVSRLVLFKQWFISAEHVVIIAYLVLNVNSFLKIGTIMVISAV